MRRSRADTMLVERGLATTADEAARLILAGRARAGTARIKSPGELLSADAELSLTEQARYVSRGGDKLAAALDHFAISPNGRVCLDAGASTGGFTDCLLQRGAAKVIAVDVGHNQLAWKIRNDPRVEVYEGLNARQLTPEVIGTTVPLAVADLSFISLTLVLASILSCVESEGALIALVKPQFELEPNQVGKGGIVRDEHLRQSAVLKIQRFATEQLRRQWVGVIESPITGAKGNKEFLACLR